ncbi:MAG TPA: LCP family protein [Acidimicrobiia bacterium]|nr:LCP family protein [Acidimicrobiia bacterium]
MATSAIEGVSYSRPWLAAVLSALVPGAGQAYARRYVRALVWFSPTVVVLASLIPLSTLGTTDLVGAAVDPDVLWAMFAANVLIALWRVAASIDAYAITSKTSGSGGSHVGFVLIGCALALVVVLPHALIGRYTYDAVTVIEAVFVTDGVPPSIPLIPIGTDADIVPDPVVHIYETDGVVSTSTRLLFRDGFGDPDAVAIWPAIVAERNSRLRSAPFPDFNERVGAGRITILFAGGDAGPGRGGLRTDAMMVATIDTATARASLFSFPRNMAQIPLPKAFEDAFVDLELRLAPPPEPVEDTTGSTDATPVEGEIPEFESCKCFPEQLNAVYPFTRRWTGTYPNEQDPGMAALRDVLENLMGMNIDYYALIDMAAFVDLVDAIGGIDVYVLQPFESEVSPPREGDPWAYVKVEPGWNHLDGPEALAYARARKDSSDYTRMARQRCMVKAVAAKSDPLTLLRSFPAIVDAITGSVVTDIPLTFLPDFIEAVSGLDFDDIETVGFTHSYWLDERDHKGHPVPDVDRIQSKVHQVIRGQSDPEAVFEVSTECET